jgi:TolA-binding protein
MKNRKWTQIFASIISGILLCTFLVGFAAPVTAYAAESGSGESSSSGSSSDTGSNEKPANSAPKRTLKPYSEKIKENKNRIRV